MAPNPRDARVTSVEPMPPNEARWIRLNKISYTDPIGRARTWESGERQTRPSTSKADGVGVIAILNYPTGPELLLQKQFRPPLNSVTIEVPSGLIDAGETASECAIRELKEETGYVATIPTASTTTTTTPPPSPSKNNDDPSNNSTSKSTQTPASAPAPPNSQAESFLMYNDPGFCNTNTLMVTVQVDVDDARNKPENLKPELEENEFIDCFSIPLDKLWSDLRRLEEEEGYAIDARVGTLALGLQIARGLDRK